MQVTETRTEGFQREFEVVLPKADLAAKVDARLGEMKQRAQIRGFRRRATNLSKVGERPQRAAERPGGSARRARSSAAHPFAAP